MCSSVFCCLEVGTASLKSGMSSGSPYYSGELSQQTSLVTLTYPVAFIKCSEMMLHMYIHVSMYPFHTSFEFAHVVFAYIYFLDDQAY